MFLTFFTSNTHVNQVCNTAKGNNENKKCFSWEKTPQICYVYFSFDSECNQGVVTIGFFKQLCGRNYS